MEPFANARPASLASCVHCVASAEVMAVTLPPVFNAASRAAEDDWGATTTGPLDEASVDAAVDEVEAVPVDVNAVDDVTDMDAPVVEVDEGSVETALATAPVDAALDAPVANASAGIIMRAMTTDSKHETNGRPVFFILPIATPFQPRMFPIQAISRDASIPIVAPHERYFPVAAPYTPAAASTAIIGEVANGTDAAECDDLHGGRLGRAVIDRVSTDDAADIVARGRGAGARVRRQLDELGSRRDAVWIGCDACARPDRIGLWSKHALCERRCLLTVFRRSRHNLRFDR